MDLATRPDHVIAELTDLTTKRRYVIGGELSALDAETLFHLRELFFVVQSSTPVVTRVPVEADANFSHGAPEALFSGSYTFNTLTDFDVSPDGQRFLLMKETQAEALEDTQLIIVENWFEELDRLAPPAD